MKNENLCTIQTSCINCATGTYQSLAGQTNCTDCATGTYQDQEGEANCKNCAAGSYQSNTGATSCILCPVGKYAANQGQIVCDDCPNGTTTTGTGSISCDVVLPVEMRDFIVKIDKNIVRLQWVTAQEVHTSFFVVQKSEDLTTWTTIARTNAKGAKNHANVYDATDPFPRNGITYYRVKTVDFDGKTAFTKAISIEFRQKTDLKIYPNPVSTQLNIAHADEEITAVAVFNSMGQMVMQYVFDKTHIAIMDLGQLITGQYIIHVTTDHNVYAQRLVKTR